MLLSQCRTWSTAHTSDFALSLDLYHCLRVAINQLMVPLLMIQDEPAFILKSYKPERYLEPVRIRGKKQRQNNPLLPLNPCEQLYADALRMELADVSSYIPYVAAFLKATANSQQPTGGWLQPEEEARLKRLGIELGKLTSVKENLTGSLQEGNKLKPEEESSYKRLGIELGKLTKVKKNLTDQELENLTRYLLYQVENNLQNLEIDILVGLPQQRRIIGENGGGNLIIFYKN